MLDHLRNLDVDDLIIMRMLLKVPRLNHISKMLGVTPPALSHRLRKYKNCIPDFELTHASDGTWTLGEGAKIFCDRASRALDVFLGGVHDPKNSDKQ